MEWELPLRWRVPPLNQWDFSEFRPLAKVKKRGAAGVVLGKSAGNGSEKAFSMRFRRAKRAGGVHPPICGEAARTHPVALLVAVLAA